MSGRYSQCDDTCTTDCGHCKGAGHTVDPARAMAVEFQRPDPAAAGPMMSGRVPDLLRYASENARSVQQLHQDDPSGVPISAIALANVVEQLVLALAGDPS